MTSSWKPIRNADVAAVFASYPPVFHRKLMVLRELILATAEATQGVGALEETLKWGEPAYVTSQTRSGSTIRLDWKKSAPTQYGLYFNCNTDLVERFRTQFPGTFRFDGNRKIVFEENDVVAVEALAFCISASLTYHLDKKSRHSKS